MPVAARPPPLLPKFAISRFPGSEIATRTQNSGSWLDDLITTTTAVCNASDLIVFPYVSFVANLVLRILQTIQTVRKNQNNFRELAQSLVQIVTTIEDTLRTYCQDHRTSHLFVTQCQSFADSLIILLSRINDLARDNQSWTRYFRADSVQDAIGQYRKQFDDLRANFILTTIMHLGVKVLFEQTPRELGYTWVHSEPVRFIDAMNITRDFPLDLCSAPNDFVDLVRFLFRKRRGRSYVERGQYALTVGDKELQWANKELWRQHVQPGHTVTMNILVRISDTKTEGQRCPSCSHRCVGTDALLHYEITCSSCTAVFRVSQSGEVINSFAPFAGDRHPRRENHDDSDDAKYFRRFYVVFENPITQGPFCITPVTNPPDGFHLEGTDFERRFESV